MHFFKEKKFGLGVAAYTYNPSTQEAEASDYQANLVYTESVPD